MKTPQEIFDIVTTHLLKQGHTCKDGLSCRYRGPDNTKCALGVLIPDALYHPAMEGYSINDVFPHLDEAYPPPEESEAYNCLRISDALMAEGVDCQSPATASLLSSLQDCHDSHPATTWATELANIAVQHKLSYDQT